MNKHSYIKHFMKGENVCAITLFRNEIIYDIDFTANRIARVNITDDEIKKVEESKKAALITTEDISKDLKQDFVDRLIRHAITDVRKKMTYAIRDDLSRMATNEIDVQEPHYDIVFSFEKGWQGSPQALCDYIHSYIVNHSLKEWFEITLPQYAATFAKRADDDIKQIQSIGRQVVLDGTPGFYL